MSEGTIRSNIHKGDEVEIVLKNDQRTGVLTHGFVCPLYPYKNGVNCMNLH